MSFKFIPYVRLEFSTGLNKEEVLRRVRQQVVPAPQGGLIDVLQPQQFSIETENEDFLISHLKPFFPERSMSYNPVMAMALQPAANGTIIRCSIRLKSHMAGGTPVIFLWVAFMLFFWIAGDYKGMAGSTASFLLVYLMTMYGFNRELRAYRRFMEDVLR